MRVATVKHSIELPAFPQLNAYAIIAPIENVLLWQPNNLQSFFSGSSINLSFNQHSLGKQRQCAYSLLAQELEKKWGKRQMSFPRRGKIVCDQGECWVNVSHTNGYVGVGISNFPIGVDVQRVRKLRQDVLESIFTSREMHEHTDDTGLVQLFSLKESFEKARNDVGMIWPACYAEYDAFFSLIRPSFDCTAVSEVVRIESLNHVASVSVIISNRYNCRE